MLTGPKVERSDRRFGPLWPALLAVLMVLAPGTSSASSTLVASAAHGGHVYELRITETPVTWQGALFEAQMLGGHLATIGNAEENEVLATLLDSATATGDICEGTRLLHWIGLNDGNEEGTWAWVNGDHFSFDNWNAGEPNNYGAGEDHVVMVCPDTLELRGKWNDTRVDHPNVYTFFCEYPPQPRFWHPAPLKAGDVFAVALDPQDPHVAYLGAENGVYKSRANGWKWARSSAGLGDVPVIALAVDPEKPSTVFAGTSGSGLYISTDAGLSWSEANNDLTATEITEIDIDPVDSSKVYLETADGVFRSTDGGVSWSLLENAPSNDVAIDPQQPSVLHTGGDGPLNHWMSTDSGDTWQAVGDAGWYGHKREWAVDPGNSGTLLYTGDFFDYYCWEEYVIRRRSDGVFQPVISELCAPKFSVVRFGAPGLAYAADPNRLYRSSDGGATWDDPLSWRDGLFTGNRVHDVAADANRVFLGTSLGIMMSSDQGSSWDWSQPGLRPSTGVAAIASGPGGEPLFAIANSVVFRSIDLGASWEPVLAETLRIVGASIAVDPVDPETAYAAIPWQAGFSGDVNSRFMKSSDSGSNWYFRSYFKEVVKILVDPTSPSNVYVAENVYYYPGVVHRSTDGGSTFTQVSTLADYRGLQDMVIDPLNSTVLYALDWGRWDNLYKSTDSASSWVVVTAGLSDGLITAVAIDPVQSQTLYAAVEEGNLHRSDDGATTWTPTRDGLPPVDIAAIAVDPNDHNQIFAATEIGVFRSANRGQSWQPTAGGLDTRSLLVTTRESEPRVWAGTRDRGLHILYLAFFSDDFESGNTATWSVTVP